jgi:hypothetical protein
MVDFVTKRVQNKVIFTTKDPKARDWLLENMAVMELELEEARVTVSEQYAPEFRAYLVGKGFTVEDT